MIYKIGMALIILTAFIISSIWIFNFINPWMGLLVGVVGIIFVIGKIFNKVKNKQNED